MMWPGNVAAQLPPGSSPREIASSRNATREELEASAIQFDRLAASTAYSSGIRERARTAAQDVRRRLTLGDFRVGDRLILNVQGSVAVTDTVTVFEGLRVTVRGIRQVSLSGVLRSELESRLLADLTEVVRNATVSARPLYRLAVFGGVGRPGYLSVPGETTLDQALTLAGGPIPNAPVEKMTIMRSDTVVMAPAVVSLAIAQGATIDALGLQDGDALVVPAAALPWDRNATLQIVGLFLSPLFAILAVRR